MGGKTVAFLILLLGCDTAVHDPFVLHGASGFLVDEAAYGEIQCPWPDRITFDRAELSSEWNCVEGITRHGGYLDCSTLGCVVFDGVCFLHYDITLNLTYANDGFGVLIQGLNTTNVYRCMSVYDVIVY